MLVKIVLRQKQNTLCQWKLELAEFQNLKTTTKSKFVKCIFRAGALCLVVMLGDSCSDGCGFESQHDILDGISKFAKCNLGTQFVIS